MRVFSVEMLVKEEGAATVQAALNRLKKETQAVAAEMKATTQSVTGTGRAMQEAGAKTEIAKDRAAKAAIGFAAVGQSIARTGSLTADAGTRIIEAGSQIALMFGPKGLAIAALLGFATAALTSFGKASAEAKKMEEDFKKSLNNIVNQGDLVALKNQLRDLELGVPSGALDEIVDVSDGILAMRTRIKELEDTGFTAFNRTNREELERLQTALAGAESNAKSLRAAILNAQAPAGSTIAAAITITGAGPAKAGGETFKKDFDLYKTASESAVKAFEAQQAELAKRPPLEIFPPEFLQKIGADLEQTARDIEQKGIDVMLPVGATIGSGLSEGLAQGIEGGVRSGLESAIASGNIGDAFKAMGQSIIQSMARAMVDVALKAINFSKMLASIQQFMAGRPLLALAAATALLVMARAAGGGAGTGGMTATGTPSGLAYAPMSAGPSTMAPTQLIFGQTSATTAAGMTPRQSMNVTVIGPNDPSAQRAIQELMTKANSRGRVG
jgi:hypothetical protein